jgi:predicted Zn-dependent peptidase
MMSGARQMKLKLESAFGAWKGAPATGPSLQPMKTVGRRSVVIVDKPGAPQTEIRIGRIGAPRVTDDYYALVVMNTILGGSFSSRLNQNLRESTVTRSVMAFAFVFFPTILAG